MFTIFCILHNLSMLTLYTIYGSFTNNHNGCVIKIFDDIKSLLLFLSLIWQSSFLTCYPFEITRYRVKTTRY